MTLISKGCFSGERSNRRKFNIPIENIFEIVGNPPISHYHRFTDKNRLFSEISANGLLLGRKYWVIMESSGIAKDCPKCCSRCLQLQTIISSVTANADPHRQRCWPNWWQVGNGDNKLATSRDQGSGWRANCIRPQNWCSCPMWCLSAIRYHTDLTFYPIDPSLIAVELIIPRRQILGVVTCDRGRIYFNLNPTQLPTAISDVKKSYPAILRQIELLRLTPGHWFKVWKIMIR